MSVERACITELQGDLGCIKGGPPKPLSGRRLLPWPGCGSVLVVSETEVRRGQLRAAQLDFARENGIEVRLASPARRCPASA